MLKKLISGGDNRISRLHTEDNVFIGFGQIATEVPVVALQKIANRIAGKRPVAPWWPLPAIRAVENALNPNMIGMEFGSGSSSIWLAKRVRHLTTREHDRGWSDTTRDRIVAEGLTNCTLEHRLGADYYTFQKDDRFDFAVVDGEYRWKCIKALQDRMNAGGFIYLDNSDSDKDKHHYGALGISDERLAQKAVLQLAERDDVTIEEFHGMINGELFAGSGILIRYR